MIERYLGSELFKSLTGVDVGIVQFKGGGPAMIDAARRDFIARGLPPEEFYADSFTYAAETEARG